MNSRAHRRAQLAILAATVRDFRRLWVRLDLERLDETWPAFERAALLLVQTRGRLSAGIAAAFYRVARRSAGIPGEPPPMQATPTAEQIVGGLRVMGPLNIRKQLELGQALADVQRAALVNVQGVVTKYTLDHGRDMLLNAVRNDPQARGWSRQTSGGACNFCEMLAGRGAVYTEATADFQSHRHCACTPVPVW